MFNIIRQGSSLIITSSDNTQFPWKDGKMSIPMNSITYVIDESNYIAFRSASNNDILFSANIDDIQINGSTVGKDDFILMFDSVANSTASGGGGSASAGVNSINGFQGDVNLKSVNGKTLIGSGNIEIEGGVTSFNGRTGDITFNGTSDLSFEGNVMYWNEQSTGLMSQTFKTINGQSIFGSIGDTDIVIEGGGSASAGISKITLGQTEEAWNTYSGHIFTYGEFMDYGDGDRFYDVRFGDSNGGSLWFGFMSSNKSILLSDGGGRLSLSINEWVGTQSEYDALGSYDSNCTYYITE